MLKTLVRHLLLLMAVIVLAGQGVGRASTLRETMMTAQASTMAGMPDCDAMRDVGKGKAPCKDLSLGCFAMAGCAAGVAIDTQNNVVASPMPLTFKATGRRLC